MSRGRGRTLVATALCAGGLAVTGAPAQASDAGLQKTVIRYENRVTPLATAFRQADKALTKGSDTDPAAAAAGAFRTGLRQFKLAVVPIRTESTRGATGKKKMLTAIRRFDVGLAQYLKLLDQIKAGADRAALQDTFTDLNVKFLQAAKEEASALRWLKIKLEG